jgi:hypothetical protein
MLVRLLSIYPVSMMKIIFIAIVFLHGTIHLMGFARAFSPGSTTTISKFISPSQGLIWLLTCCLFIAVATGILLRKEWWPWIAVIAVIVSQIIIMLNWKDARFGTLANSIILIVAIIGYADMAFKKQCSEEVSALFSQSIADKKIVTPEQVLHLPAIVQRWLNRSEVINQPAAQTIRLRQSGEMRMKPGGRWMPFTATQYFTTGNPGFVWTTRLRLFPSVFISGRDKLVKGNAEMKMKLLSVIDIVNERNNEKINSGSMIRYLAEICWFPSAAIQPYIEWQTIDSVSASATLAIAEKKVHGIFHFSNEGDLLQFTAERYRGSDDKATPETWIVECLEYREFNGIRIPYRCDVTWREAAGDFTWLRLQITAIDYNIPTLYKTDRH